MPKDYPLVFVVGGVIAATILAMSTFFLVKSVKRAKEIGMSSARIRTAIKSSALFSVVPSLPIVIGVGIMMSFLGIAIPWIRLSVIGALQYEIIAMNQVEITRQAIITDSMVATALVIMTIGILSGNIFNIFFYKKYKGKLDDLQKNNKKLLDTITGSLLGGILAGLASYIIIAAFFSGSKQPSEDSVTVVANGYITLITLGVSMLIMASCGFLISKLKWKWLENYALPLTILLSMAAAYGLTFVPAFA
jgi:phosphatidylglycerophosphatase A